jgi:hypothetical protein
VWSSTTVPERGFLYGSRQSFRRDKFDIVTILVDLLELPSPTVPALSARDIIA